LKYTFENKVEFYITNVCNLTCENCNRFNNHKFTGWQRWSDYADVYQQWSKYIDLKNVVLMGGEPLLNPTIADWVVGISDTFNCGVQILSNGLQLKQNPTLYDALARSVTSTISISLHNLDHFETIKNNIKSFLQTPKEEFGIGINKIYPDDPDAYYSLRDVNDVMVRMHLSNSFHNASVYKNSQGQFTLRNSDPIEAHHKCGFAKYKCYHFIRGRLYKCGPVALMPEFDDQHNLAISKTDRKLLHSYRPLEIKDWPKKALKWLEQLDDPIAQCKFCPTSTPENITIHPLVKGSKTY
jgi:organic radical activating enzyme